MGGFNKLALVLFLIVPVILSFALRMSASNMPITDQWAASTVYNHYSSQIKAQVNQQYPNLPEQKKTELVNQQMQTIVKDPSFNNQIKDASVYFKTFYKYDNDKYFYMPDIDPYEYVAETQELLDHGHIGDIKKDDGYWYQMNALAPTGQKIYVQDLHPLVLSWAYRIGKIFNSGTNVMQTSMYVSTIFASLATIFVFLIVKKFAGNVGGFFGALLYGIHPMIMTRTLWGHADTDIWQILFMPMIIYFAIEMMTTESKKRYIFAALGGLAVGLFSFSWSQWYITFDVLLGCFGICIFLQLINLAKRENSWQAAKSSIFVILTFIFTTGIFVSLIGVGGWHSFFDAPFVVFSNFGIKEAAYSDLWPNVYTTVAELAPVNFSGVIGTIGKMWIFIGLAGLAISLIKKEWLLSLVITLFFFTATVSSIVAGFRFVMFAVLPVAIAVGYGVGIVHRYATEWVVKAI